MIHTRIHDPIEIRWRCSCIGYARTRLFCPLQYARNCQDAEAKEAENCTPLPGLERLNLVNFLIVQIGGEKQSPTEE